MDKVILTKKQLQVVIEAEVKNVLQELLTRITLAIDTEQEKQLLTEETEKRGKE